MLDGNLPFALLRLPFSLLYFLPRAEILIDIVLSRDSLPVVSDLIPLGKFFSPLSIRRNAGLIDMRRDITPNTGVGILKPDSQLVEKHQMSLLTLTKFRPHLRSSHKCVDQDRAILRAASHRP